MCRRASVYIVYVLSYNVGDSFTTKIEIIFIQFQLLFFPFSFRFFIFFHFCYRYR